MRQKTVLVTGATGFTGGHLASALLERGYKVKALVRAAAGLNGLGDRGVIPVVGDLRDPAAVDRAVADTDAVYHIAAAYREALPYAELEAINVGGTKNVLEAARRHGVGRIVHCSTVGVHGHIQHPPANENAPFDPYDDYQSTKADGERLARSYQEAGLPVTIFRPVGMFGPGDTRFLKLFRSIQKGLFVMFGDGRALYHMTYIDDLIRGIVACGEHPAAVGKTYIIAGPPAVTLNELTAKIAEVLGVRPPRLRLPFGLLWGASVACETVFPKLGLEPPLYRRRADWFRKDRSFDASRIKRDLNVAPEVDLEEGLRRTAEWYRSKNLL